MNSKRSPNRLETLAIFELKYDGGRAVKAVRISTEPLTGGGCRKAIAEYGKLLTKEQKATIKYEIGFFDERRIAGVNVTYPTTDES